MQETFEENFKKIIEEQIKTIEKKKKNIIERNRKETRELMLEHAPIRI